MSAIQRFEDIEAWQLARKVTQRVYELSSTGEFARDFGLKDQIRRSAVSIMSNIAEGFERDGNREFVNFLSIAKGSCGEARSQLCVAFDQKLISEDDFRTINSDLTKTGRMNYLKQSDLKGKKFT